MQDGRWPGQGDKASVCGPLVKEETPGEDLPSAMSPGKPKSEPGCASGRGLGSQGSSQSMADSETEDEEETETEDSGSEEETESDEDEEYLKELQRAAEG